MKRLISLACGFLVFAGGLATVWVSCAQASLRPGEHGHPTAVRHAHDHHPHAQDDHSHNAVIHCPTLDEFVPGAAFSTEQQPRLERLKGVFGEIPWTQANLHDWYGSSHGPPGTSRFATIPPYLTFSVLRI